MGATGLGGAGLPISEVAFPWGGWPPQPSAEHTPGSCRSCGESASGARLSSGCELRAPMSCQQEGRDEAVGVGCGDKGDSAGPTGTCALPVILGHKDAADDNRLLVLSLL